MRKIASFLSFKSPIQNRRCDQAYMKILGWVTDSGNKEGEEAIERYKKHLNENFLSPCLKYLVKVHILSQLKQSKFRILSVAYNYATKIYNFIWFN